MRNLIFIVIVLFWACESKNKTNFVELDLMSYGMPIKVNAPELTEVKKSNISLQKELNLYSNDGYEVIVSMDDAITLDEAKMKDEQLKMAKAHRYFFRIVHEDDNGFIYENRIDSSNTSFGFNYVFIQGDKEFLFQNSRSKIFDLQSTKQMYGAVQQDNR